MKKPALMDNPTTIADAQTTGETVHQSAVMKIIKDVMKLVNNIAKCSQRTNVGGRDAIIINLIFIQSN